MFSNVKDIKKEIKTKILYDCSQTKGTYEIYTCFRREPAIFANLFIDTKRHQYYFELPEGDLADSKAVDFLVERLKENILDVIAEYSNKESLEYRTGKEESRKKLYGSTNKACDDKEMKGFIELFSENAKTLEEIKEEQEYNKNLSNYVKGNWPERKMLKYINEQR